MAAQTVNLAPISDTDANFRLWGKAISDQMAAGGWVQTTDTGQINWATVNRTASTNTAVGYEVWRSNDGGGSYHQIYVKIEYGSGSAANTPSVWITAGFGSNGSGTLSGTTTTRTQNTANSNSATLAASYLSASTGRFAFHLFNTNNITLGFMLERTLDSSLAQKDEICVILMNSNSPPAFRQVLNYSGGAYPILTTTTYGCAVVDSNSLQSGNAGIGLLFGQAGGLTAPLLNVIGVYSTNLGSQGTQVNVPVYGSAINYIVCSSSIGNSNTVLMRYE